MHDPTNEAVEWEKYLLVCLMEECAEVAKVVSKIYRFGQHDCEPGTTTPNIELLAAELGDIHGLLDMLLKEGVKIDLKIFVAAKAAKEERVKKFYRRSGR